jgi:hypothetical protein
MSPTDLHPFPVPNIYGAATCCVVKKFRTCVFYLGLYVALRIRELLLLFIIIIYVIVIIYLDS